MDVRLSVSVALQHSLGVPHDRRPQSFSSGAIQPKPLVGEVGDPTIHFQHSVSQAGRQHPVSLVPYGRPPLLPALSQSVRQAAPCVTSTLRQATASSSKSQ